MIPKIMHFVWVGDESKRPDNCINTWRDLNPTWELKIWGNKEYTETPWVNKRHMAEMWNVELNGVADMMRWEILYNVGGFAIDADSICVRPLEDWLCEAEVFTCWENEIDRVGLLAAGYCGARPNNEFIGNIINDIRELTTTIDRRAWLTVGPVRITNSWVKHKYNELTIHPSHYFIPEHNMGRKYAGRGTVFARQLWGNTFSLYDTLYQKKIDELGKQNEI